MAIFTKENAKKVGYAAVIGTGIYLGGPYVIKGAQFVGRNIIEPTIGFTQGQYDEALHGPRPVSDLGSLSDLISDIEDRGGSVDDLIKEL
ncbi:MAG: hypothetical protein ACMG6E_06345, partial [Candidatus Roizmanbacteria bacterium]